MAVASRSQPLALVSNGLSVTTAVLNVAGAATDAVPIVKQILNSAAHISAVAEKIQRKQEVMYTLVEKADIYATQIGIAVAGRILDASLQRRLERLYCVFQTIEALVSDKTGSRTHLLIRVWQKVITKPNRAETLVTELDREIQLFQLLTGIQLSLVVDTIARAVDGTARAVAVDARYDGEIRVLRDCDIEMGTIIKQRETDQGRVVWASARVHGQLMVVRYLDSPSIPKRENAPWRRDRYGKYLENIKELSTIHSSHPHVVQLYGRQSHGSGTVFTSGCFALKGRVKLNMYLRNLRCEKGGNEEAAVTVTLIYKMLDASSHLTDVHGLMWVGTSSAVIVDENGEPLIGLFDDIVRADRELEYTSLGIYLDILMWFNSWSSTETGVVEQVHDSDLQAIIAEHLRDGNDADYLQQVWDTIRRERLPVGHTSLMFPVASGNISLSPQTIARAQRYFETLAKKDPRHPKVTFLRRVLAGDATISSPILISFLGSGNDSYSINVQTCTYDDKRIRYDWFYIDIPARCPLLREVARAVGLDNFVDTGSSEVPVTIYPRAEDRR